MTCLIKHTSGEAKELVKGFVHSISGKCFEEAMSALEREYGNCHFIASAYLKKLKDWPAIKYSDSRGFKTFCHFLNRCKVIKSSELLSSLDSVEMIRSVLSKYPTPVQEAWNKKVLGIRQNHGRQCNFLDIVEFAEHQSMMMTNPEFSREAFDSSRDKNPAKARAFVVSKPDSPSAEICSLCNSEHQLQSCDQFSLMPIREREEFVKQQHLCFGCLTPTSSKHYSRVCKDRLVCSICSGNHPTLLHRDRKEGNVTVAHTKAKTSQIKVVNLSVVPVEVWHKADPSHKVKTYALLDECSEGTFVSQNLLDVLPLAQGCKADLTLETLCGTKSVSTMSVQDLVVSCGELHAEKYSAVPLNLPTTFLQESIPLEMNCSSYIDAIERWPHLRKLSGQLQSPKNGHVGLLIGANVPKALEPQEIITGNGNSPYAKRTALGWAIIGPCGDTGKGSIACHRVGLRTAAVDISTNQIAKHHFQSVQSVKDQTLANDFYKMYCHEFDEHQGERSAYSIRDKEFLKI